ncbi:hypothetical protein [Pontibacter anaerobius]|uniref:PH domain-containing protein n=1 Tax=Pontibacter anaerobius TaxID=2993940 RepID=A0ABT3RI85_9BACT|nr:hypothetical protein [Pontibacter anaerobius]MCX2741578.1 hypothetical protein [Pontibacter anaerobius]
MEKNSKNIGGGSAILGQAMLLLFFVPFCLFLLYIITRNFSIEGVAFVSVILVLSILVVVHAYTYADIYLEGDNIIVKKLFYVKSKPIAAYRTVEQAIMPLKYCIIFQDGSKACFVLSISSIFRHVISSDPNRVLKELRFEFQRLKQERSIIEQKNGSCQQGI